MQYKTKADLDRSIDELKNYQERFHDSIYTLTNPELILTGNRPTYSVCKRDISIHCTSYAGAISIIEEEIHNLKQQEFNINTGKAKLFVAIEKKKEKDFQTW